jgi:hypothetical protein
MTKKIKTLSAVIILSAAVATPGFAQPTHRGRVHDLRNFRGVYNQSNEPLYVAPRTLDRSDTNGFGLSGRDPSWVGGNDPSLNPSGS